MKLFQCRYAPMLMAIWMFTLVTLVTSPFISATEQYAVSSGTNRVALVELYTSEGCSSCPPADRWLSSLATQPEIATSVIPLALHVDYWDYIGWKDRFAQPLFADRQKEMALRNSSSQVYTPQVALNGENFRTGSRDSFLRAVKAITQLPATVKIHLSLMLVNSNHVVLNVSAEASHGMALYVAIYQNDLYSEVKLGENQGHRLHHDAVVREWNGPFPIGVDGHLNWQKSVLLKPEWVKKNMGVVAFIQDQATGEVMQALKLPWALSH